jgi:hypothetical protein
MSDISLGTVYDINKNLMQNEKRLSNNILNKKIKEIARFFTKGKYFMLLCHEQRDYTIFQLTTEEKSKKASEELKLCMENRGEILSIDETPDGAYEIWIRNIQGAFVYYLFPYDEAVIIC